MRLVVVESPAKCSKIQGFLGPGYKVIASMGHIRALVQDLDAVGINKGFEPTYEFMKEKGKAISQLKDAARGAEQVILCSDDDREGEAIAYSVAVLLGLNPATNPRAAFREITKSAVCGAVNSPRTIDMNRVNSQQTRAMLDMMVGFTISPLLWKNVAPALSAGRCQTPALRLVCEREAVINDFKSEASWSITGLWKVAGSKVAWPAALTEDLCDEESSLNYLENHKDDPSGTIVSAETKGWTEGAPQALMTSTLQQQASNLFCCNPKRTMQIAQKLYEAGHITYMRTDQTSMSEEAVEAAQSIVRARWGTEYVGAKTAPAKAAPAKKSKKEDVKEADKPQAQEAHEAIRPTHFENNHLPASEDWGHQERKIYHLIWLRAIQSIMAPARGETRDLRFDATGDEGEFPWKATWRRTTFPGWRAADEKETRASAAAGAEEAEEADSGENDWKLGESLMVGQAVEWRSLSAKPQETKPPGRYTEASLVRELEKKGIGRPSTFASLIATILEKAYVEVRDIPQTTRDVKWYCLNSPGSWPPTAGLLTLKRGGEKQRMIPTSLGKSVLDFTLKHFPDLFDFTFTSGMESRLDKIAEGSEPWKKVLEDTWNSYKDRYSSLKGGKRAEGTGGGGSATAGGPQKFQESMGDFDGYPVIRKVGRFGPYVEWNGTNISCAAGDTFEEVCAKIRTKQAAVPAKTLGPFAIKVGPYGPYIMRTDTPKGEKPKFVSLPAGTDQENLTAESVAALYEEGLKAKAAAGTSGGRGGRGGFRGGRGGLGGFRGRGRGK